jgi:hypothetical protein
MQRGDSTAESEEVEHQLVGTTEPEDEEPVAGRPPPVTVNHQKGKCVTWDDQPDEEEDAKNDSIYVNELAGESGLEPGVPEDEYSMHSDEKWDEEDGLLEPVILAPKPAVAQAPKKGAGHAKAGNGKPPTALQGMFFVPLTCQF